MKSLAKTMAVAALMALLAGCSAGVSERLGGQSVEVFAASVGKGDAILLKVDGWCGLIDAGKPKAMGKVKAAMAATGVAALDAVFLTHTDSDHGGGLAWLAASDIPVGTWYASGRVPGVKEKKHPAVKAAQARGQAVQWLERGDAVALGDTGAVLRVRAPAQLFTDQDDNNSLVLMLETAQGRALFTGDMELPEEASLLAQGDDLRCAVLKAPNHGDDDTVSSAFASACQAQVAVISTDSLEKPGTPDPGVVSRLMAAGTACHVTQDAGLGLRVVLSGGRAAVEYVDADAPARDDLYIAEVVPGDDLVTVANPGPDCDLTGWYLHSDRGDELFAFPEGYVLPANAAVTVCTRSSDGGYDLLWDDKKVVHPSKTDVVALYDGWGRPVDERDNGM